MAKKREKALRPKNPTFNPVAVEIVERGLRGIEPAIPPAYEGLELPVTHLTAVLDWIVPQFALRMSSKAGAALRRDWQHWRGEFERMADPEGLLHL
jgi:hypothetical protein